MPPGKKNNLQQKRAIAVTACLVLAGFARVGAADELYSPNTEYREISLEYNRSQTFDRDPGKDGARESEVALEAGITPRLMVAVSAVSAREPGDVSHLGVREVEGRYQFFEPGEKWLDAGMLVAYDFAAQNGMPDSLEAKLLLQHDEGKFTSTANIGFTQNVGSHSANTGGPDYVFLWNTRYRYSAGLQPGIELQSDLGQGHQIRNFNEQTHYLGPALYGKLFGPLPQGQAIKYQVAYLFGASNAAAHGMARALVEYETHF